jgi:uncharacterized protein (TIGR03083 family)
MFADIVDSTRCAEGSETDAGASCSLGTIRSCAGQSNVTTVQRDGFFVRFDDQVDPAGFGTKGEATVKSYSLCSDVPGNLPLAGTVRHPSRMAIGPMPVESIPRITRAEAPWHARTAYRRIVLLLEDLLETDWARPTDCAGWDVRAMVAHLAGATAFCVSIGEGSRQAFAGRHLVKGTDRPLIDGINEVQLRERAGRTPAELVEELRRKLPKAVHRRATYPRVLRRMRFSDPTVGSVSLGELMDVTYTRDAWLHRVDLARATEHPLLLTPDHDGRVVADVVRDWADRHGRPFLLELEGAAGGSFTRGEGGEEHRLDAVEFCRILSGRGAGRGLLAIRVLF